MLKGSSGSARSIAAHVANPGTTTPRSLSTVWLRPSDCASAPLASANKCCMASARLRAVMSCTMPRTPRMEPSSLRSALAAMCTQISVPSRRIKRASLAVDSPAIALALTASPSLRPSALVKSQTGLPRISSGR